MQPTQPLVLVATLMMAWGAGCVGSSGSAALNAAAPSHDDTTGSISGSVQSDEIQPIANATVGIASTPPITATTDAAGAYVLNFVPPGPQVVSVIALGYASLSKKVDVTVGQTTENVNFVLTALASPGPYHKTDIFKEIVTGYIFKLTPDCMYPVPGQATVKTCVGGGGCAGPPLGASQPNCITEVQYGHCGDGGTWTKWGCDFTPEWKSIVGEVRWTPQSGVTGRGWIFEILAPNVTRANADGTGSVDQSDKHDWIKISSKSPIRTTVDDSNFLQGAPTGTSHPIKPEDRCGGNPVSYPHCNWVWRIFPGWCTIGGATNDAVGCGNYGPDFQVDLTGNPVEIYFSYFVRDAAPAGFTALADR